MRAAKYPRGDRTIDAPALRNKTVVFFGRLSGLPQHRATRLVAENGGRTRRGLTRATDIVVVGHGAVDRLLDTSLDVRLDRARTHGVKIWSENCFLRCLGLADAIPPARRTIPLPDLAAQAGLEERFAWHLVLFDVIEQDDDGMFGFRDLVAAREAASLYKDGAEEREIVASMAEVRRRRGAVPSQVHFTRGDNGEIRLLFGRTRTALDGQTQLDFPPTANPTVDELFELAEDAEAAGELYAAERLYRRCGDLDRSDPIIPFNLANVLREEDHRGEARLQLQRALQIDSKFAEAWYNLADLAQLDEDHAQAKTYLQHALAVDADYADALYNLGHVHYKLGELEEAGRSWERYLEFDQSSDWGRTAREGLRLCHVAKKQRGGAGL